MKEDGEKMSICSKIKCMSLRLNAYKHKDKNNQYAKIVNIFKGTESLELATNHLYMKEQSENIRSFDFATTRM